MSLTKRVNPSIHPSNSQLTMKNKIPAKWEFVLVEICLGGNVLHNSFKPNYLTPIFGGIFFCYQYLYLKYHFQILQTETDIETKNIWPNLLITKLKLFRNRYRHRKNIVSVITAKFRTPAQEGVVCLIGYVANNLV